MKEEEQQVDEYYEEEVIGRQLSKTFSDGKKHYKRVNQGDVLNRIENDIKNIRDKTALERHWSILLFERCHWKNQEVDNLIGQDKFNFKELINYKPGYKIEESSQNKMCNICFSEGKIITNSCGHTACIQCWKSILQVSFESKVVIPKCFDIKCTHKINALLIEFVLSDPQYQYLKPKYNRELVAAYCQTNYQFKVCPNPKCQTEFLIDLAISKPIECFCGAQICTMCGKYFHFPAECHEVDKWQKLASAKENEWIKILFFKKCPKCDTPIEKNEGCNHMTCKCTYQFCWKCLQNWKTHPQVCSELYNHDKYEEEQKKLIKNTKMTEQGFQKINDEVERLNQFKKRILGYELSQYRFQISKLCSLQPSDLFFFNQLFFIVNTSLQFSKSYQVYSFFTPENQCNKRYQIQIKTAYDTLNTIDDFVSDVAKNYLLYVEGQQQKQNSSNQQQIQNMNTRKSPQSESKYLVKLVQLLSLQNLAKINNLISMLAQNLKKMIANYSQ